MDTQLTSNAEALRLFFTEDIYLVTESIAIDKIVNGLDVVEFKFLGKNQKNVLILVNDSLNDVSTEQGKKLLRKLLKAINLTNNDFALVNYADYTSAKYKKLESFFGCRIMIAFGVEPMELDLPTHPMHQLVTYNEAKHVFAKNLHELDSDLTSKKILWASLQQLKI
ncbi:hypothetical protein WG904_01490 [Pedobacter sp. Du54]|uniref:hypothetical protein n=1 Tax=Pedobacter anseongensis TaxID=3133439 RepID=UPI00309E7F5C